MNIFRSAALLCGVGMAGMGSLPAARGADLAQEYNQVRIIAMKDPGVRKAFDRANEKLNRRIIAIDPALKPFVEKKDAAKAPNEMVKQSPHLSASTTHLVAKGETLTSIARQYKVSVNSLTRANNIAKDATLRVGQKLIIPSAPRG
ncbi:MAG: LysM domain-containing protein [Terrimicrobiaceae bacterium]